LVSVAGIVLQAQQGQQQVERAVDRHAAPGGRHAWFAAWNMGLLGGQELRGHRERVDQEQVDLVGEGEADAEADGTGPPRR
jgi:hypothetical protein